MHLEWQRRGFVPDHVSLVYTLNNTPSKPITGVSCMLLQIWVLGCLPCVVAYEGRERQSACGAMY